MGDLFLFYKMSVTRIPAWLNRIGSVRGLNLGATLNQMYGRITDAFSFDKWPEQEAKFNRFLTNTMEESEVEEEKTKELTEGFVGTFKHKSTLHLPNPPTDRHLTLDEFKKINEDLNRILLEEPEPLEKEKEADIDWEYYEKRLINKKFVPYAKKLLKVEYSPEDLSLAPSLWEKKKFQAADEKYGSLRDPREIATAMESEGGLDTSLMKKIDEIAALRKEGGYRPEAITATKKKLATLVYQMNALEYLWNRRHYRTDEFMESYYSELLKSAGTLDEDSHMTTLRIKHDLETLIVLEQDDPEAFFYRFPKYHEVYVQYILQNRWLDAFEEETWLATDEELEAVVEKERQAGLTGEKATFVF